MPLQRPPPRPTSWVHAYELVPPQSRDRLRSLQVRHILIVSDRPELDAGASQRLEAELRRLDAGFAVTAPLPVADD